MPQQRAHTQADLEAFALGFVVQVQGSWTEEALGSLRAELTRQGFTPTDHEITAALEHARQRFCRDQIG